MLKNSSYTHIFCYTIHFTMTLKVDVPDTNTMLKTITQHAKQNSDNYNGFQRCYGQGKDY